MRPRLLALISAAATAAAVVPAAALPSATTGSGPLGVARDAAPVVLTGAQIPAWSAPPAEGLAQPQPSGASSDNPLGDELRSAHNGRLVVPPTPLTVTAVKPDDVAAYSWDGNAWKQIPVQVDQRFPYFLANGRSGFGFYSGTDEELTYPFAADAHDIGEEAWKAAMFGYCYAHFPTHIEDVTESIDAFGWPSLGPQETPADYLTSMQDPQPLFDADDELSFMASDAGAMVPVGTAPPKGASN